MVTSRIWWPDPVVLWGIQLDVSVHRPGPGPLDRGCGAHLAVSGYGVLVGVGLDRWPMCGAMRHRLTLKFDVEE